MKRSHCKLTTTVSGCEVSALVVKSAETDDWELPASEDREQAIKPINKKLKVDKRKQRLIIVFF